MSRVPTARPCRCPSRSNSGVRTRRASKSRRSTAASPAFSTAPAVGVCDPGASGAPEVKAFSKEEASYARDEFVIDGPLIDYAAKGVAVKLAGLDDVDGRKAYLLEVTLPSGASRRMWIDAQTFLDVRVDRPSTSPLTKGAPVSIYYSDYRSIDGVMIPHAIESRTAFGARAAETARHRQGGAESATAAAGVRQARGHLATPRDRTDRNRTALAPPGAVRSQP